MSDFDDFDSFDDSFDDDDFSPSPMETLGDKNTELSFEKIKSRIRYFQEQQTINAQDNKLLNQAEELIILSFQTHAMKYFAEILTLYYDFVSEDFIYKNAIPIMEVIANNSGSALDDFDFSETKKQKIIFTAYLFLLIPPLEIITGSEEVGGFTELLEMTKLLIKHK